MSFAILRIKKHSNLGTVAGVSAHVHRQRETPNADPSRTHKNKTFIGTDSIVADVQKRLDAAGVTSVRKNGVVAIEHMLAVSPDFFTGGNVNERLDDWIRRSGRWLQERYGKQNLVSFVVHLDESTPHIHAVVVPLEKKEQGRFAGQERLNARKFCGGRQVLSEMQDSYAAAMAPLGLQRGRPRSKAKHTTIQAFYANAEADIQHRTQIAEDRARSNVRRELMDWISRPEYVAENHTAQQLALEQNKNQNLINQNQKLIEEIARLKGEKQEKQTVSTKSTMNGPR